MVACCIEGPEQLGKLTCVKQNQILKRGVSQTEEPFLEPSPLNAEVRLREVQQLVQISHATFYRFYVYLFTCS